MAKSYYLLKDYSYRDIMKSNLLQTLVLLITTCKSCFPCFCMCFFFILLQAFKFCNIYRTSSMLRWKDVGCLYLDFFFPTNILASFLVQIVPVTHSSIVVINNDFKIECTFIRVTEALEDSSETRHESQVSFLC